MRDHLNTPLSSTDSRFVTKNGHVLPTPRPATSAGWPLSSKLFDAEIMSGERLRTIIDNTKYSDTSYVDYLEAVGGRGCLFENLPAHEEDVANSLFRSAQDFNPDYRIFFIKQKRIYQQASQTTFGRMGLRQDTWIDLLNSLSILPNFVRVLDDNNGGYSGFISYATDGVTPEMFHLSFKAGMWMNSELAVYIKHELRTSSNIVLICGREADLDIFKKSLNTTMNKNAGAVVNPFSILVQITGDYAAMIESHRWRLDLRVLTLESKTGCSSFYNYPGSWQVPAEELDIARDIFMANDLLSNVGYAAAFQSELLAWIIDQLEVFDRLRAKESDVDNRKIRSALQEERSFSIFRAKQIAELKKRIQTQLGVLNSKINQWDSQTAIKTAKTSASIAELTRRDSIAMKVIAGLTMVFLPGTFIATFFSMSFFHVGGETEVQLIVDKAIWLYAAAAVPFTLITVAIWYAWLKHMRKTAASIETKEMSVISSNEEWALQRSETDRGLSLLVD